MILPISAQKEQAHGYPITPVPFTSVKVASGSFWGPRHQTIEDATANSDVACIAMSKEAAHVGAATVDGGSDDTALNDVSAAVS